MTASRMPHSIWPWWLALALVLVGIAAAVYVYTGQPGPPPTPAPEVPAPAAPPAPLPVPPPPVLPPMAPPAAVEIPLPALDASDATLREAFTELLGAAPVERYLLPDEIVRRLVATIDNLPRLKIAQQIRPLTAVNGEFQVAGEEDERVLDAANFARYRPLVTLFGAVDAQALVALYRRHWPLFQQAYDELGNPPQHFDARLVEVIDHLLEAPRVDGPIRLVQPNVFYQFADPALESRSAGQKILIRIGPANADVVKAKLRELRAALVQSRG